MKLFKIWQTENDGYDFYDSAVVCAVDEEDARTMHPSGDIPHFAPNWTDEKNVFVQYIGDARQEIPRSVICASFNAG